MDSFSTVIRITVTHNTKAYSVKTNTKPIGIKSHIVYPMLSGFSKLFFLNFFLFYPL